MTCHNPTKIPLNGTDCLMLAFDIQMKKAGYVGNVAQIVLGLSKPIDAHAFKQQVSRLKRQFPIMAGRIRRYFFSRIPHWHLKQACKTKYPNVHTHTIDTGKSDQNLQALKNKLLNQPLRTSKGEWLRFDLIMVKGHTDCGQHKPAMEIVMTWNHALMDAQGAEALLALIARPGNETSLSPIGGPLNTKTPFEQQTAPRPWSEKWQYAQQALQYVDNLALKQPVSLFTRMKRRPSTRFVYFVREFSARETETILGLARRTSGLLNDSSYYLAAVLTQFHNLYQRKQISTQSYVVAFPISLRKIGTRLPIFTNQAATLLFGFTKEQAEKTGAVIQQFKDHFHQVLTDDVLLAGLYSSNVARIMPSWLYVRKIKQSMKGEISSLVFANPGKTPAVLSRFMGAPVIYQHHIPTVVVPPGVGIVFYQFKEKLMMTFICVEELLTQSEVQMFLDGIHSALLATAQSS